MRRAFIPVTDRVRVIEIVAPVIATLRDYLDHGGRSGVDSLLTNPSSRSWSATAAMRLRSTPPATT